ncbi:AfsR/SARP family transcriptional regulator [Actinoplanes sp. CA-015351]|uniref:AfsR/SARP family transcriptional regulator n=1 Tax=Actinoplanes sp. CA-015351 TaxID=3239897 RepID=UPI003D95218E
MADAGPAEPSAALAILDEALAWWRGPAYADFPGLAWPRADRSRLAELWLQAVERRAQARFDRGRAADAVPDLDARGYASNPRSGCWGTSPSPIARKLDDPVLLTFASPEERSPPVTNRRCAEREKHSPRRRGSGPARPAAC